MNELQKLIAELSESKTGIKEAIAETETRLRMLKVLERTEKASQPPKPRAPRKKKDAA